MNRFKNIALLFTLFFLFNVVFVSSVSACKDIVAVGDATDGDYNLLMKVRDPSRPGLQVLCIIPEGYEYTYRHPWTGKPMSFTTEHKYIGVASKDDVIPNIVKAGMSLSDAGIAYGDADTGSRWINPTRNAWDDFDWIRYACQTADTGDEAVQLLTEDAVKKMHATGVSENLFVVGPDKGFVVEGDAFHYKVEEIVNGVSVRHNYPKLLWKTQRIKLFPISRTFDTSVEKSVRKMGVVRLGSLYGVRVVEIGEDYVDVKPVGLIHALKTNNVGVVTRIQLGERESVGGFSVKLVEINGNKAKLSVCNIYKAWEDEIMKHIQPRYGDIDVADMISWSRFTSEDLDGLRGMSQSSREYEAVAIYKIPKNNYEDLSMGWFSPNNALSSIYVPFHICNTDIYGPYQTGQAAQLSIDLLQVYDNLSEPFSKVEDVFLFEIESMEQISNDNYDVSEFLTIVDVGMQRQAYHTQDLWKDISTSCNKKEIIEIVSDIWQSNYSVTLEKIQNATMHLKECSGSEYFVEKIGNIALDICKTRIDAAGAIGKQSPDAENDYSKGSELLNQGKYETGFDYIEKAFSECTMLMQGKTIKDIEDKSLEGEDKSNLFVSIIFVLIAILLLIMVFIKKR